MARGSLSPGFLLPHIRPSLCSTCFPIQILLLNSHPSPSAPNPLLSAFHSDPADDCPPYPQPDFPRLPFLSGRSLCRKSLPGPSLFPSLAPSHTQSLSTTSPLVAACTCPSPPDSYSSPTRGGRNGKDNQGSCSFFYDKFLPN
jgi:hypothetical protein